MAKLVLILALFGLIGLSFGGGFFGDIPSQFNTFIKEDFCCQNSDTDGRLAAGGDVDVTNYGIGCKIRPPPQGNCIQFGSVTCASLKQKNEFEFSLVGGGNVKVSNNMLFTGGLAYGQSLTKIGSGTTVTSDCAVKKSSPIDFDYWNDHLKDLSKDLAKLAVTGSTEVTAWGAITLKGCGNKQLEVFYVCGADLAKASSLTISGVADGATVIINVNGASLKIGQFGFFGFCCDFTLFNFFEASCLTFYNIGWKGSVLAPCADFVDPTGSIEGQLFAKSWKSSGSTCMQQNSCPFKGHTKRTSRDSTDKKTTDRKSTDRKSTDRKSTDRKSTDRKTTDRKTTDRHSSREH